MSDNAVTEEAFVYATLCEFVKLWGNGSQAFLQLQCHGGQAWIQLMSSLGPPSSPHLFRQDDHHHGCHGPDHGQYRRRRKGAKQRDRDRARAALHRASLLEAAAATSPPATGPETSHCTQQPLLPHSPVLVPAPPPRHGGGPQHVPPPPPAATPLPQEDQNAHHRAGLPATQRSPDPHLHTQSEIPDNPPVHYTSPAYSLVAQIFSKTPARQSDQPASPAGWGAVDPTRAEGGNSDSDSEDHLYDSEVNDGEEHVYGADLSSFCFLSSEPSPHLPPASSRTRPTTRLHPTYYLNRIRKPVKHLKVLLSQNIERAVFSRPAGSTVWVWDVSVKRDFVENMVWDHTSFHGVSYSEEYEYEVANDTFGGKSDGPI
jgi:hypothetical protein